VSVCASPTMDYIERVNSRLTEFYARDDY